MLIPCKKFIELSKQCSPGLVGLSHSVGSLAGVAGALCAEYGLGAGLVEFELDDRNKPSAEFVRNEFVGELNIVKLSLSNFVLASSLHFDE